MSGSIKVGGHTVFVHTGASGAGTLSVQGQNGNTLLTDDGTAVSLGNNVRLPASGGIKDSSGNNVLTESGGNTTIGSGVVFPAGHIIQTQILDWQETTGNIFTTNSSYSNVGISGSFQTLKSSSESFLFFELYSGMTHTSGTTGSQLDFCLTSSDNTTHSDGNSLSDVIYRNYYEPKNIEYEFNTFKAFFKAGTRTTSNLSSYSENQTLYLRIFAKTLTTFVVAHNGSNYYLLMQEIAL